MIDGHSEADSGDERDAAGVDNTDVWDDASDMLDAEVLVPVQVPVHRMQDKVRFLDERHTPFAGARHTDELLSLPAALDVDRLALPLTTAVDC